MLKYITVLFIAILFFSSTNTFSQNDWKTDWSNTLSKLDSMFYREQTQFRTMQGYQNDATEDLILKDIDTLTVFVTDVDVHIAICNNYKFPSESDAINASETFRLKLEGLKEYFEQCRMQIHVNNNILQRKLKNETLDFKVKQIDDLKLGNYAPVLK